MDYKEQTQRSINVSLTISKEAKCTINSWLKPVKLSCKDFPKVLEEVGIIGESISIVEKKDSYKFSGMTYFLIVSGNNEWNITLRGRYDRMRESYEIPTIEVQSEEQEATYVVFNSDGMHKIRLVRKKMQYEATTLDCGYYSYNYEKKLSQGGYTLTLDMCEPDTEHYKQHGEEYGYVARLSRNNNEVEKYLLSLDLSEIQKLDEVWNKIKSIMELSDDEIKTMKYIHLILEGQPYVHGISLAELCYNYGKLKRYGKNHNQEARICIGYSADGDKSEVSYYQSKYDLRIEGLSSDSKSMNVSFKIPKEELDDFDTDIKKIIEAVKNEISNM